MGHVLTFCQPYRQADDTGHPGKSQDGNYSTMHIALFIVLCVHPSVAPGSSWGVSCTHPSDPVGWCWGVQGAL